MLGEYAYKLARPLAWTHAENGDVLVPDARRGGPPLRLVAWSESLLEGVRAAEPFDDLARRFPPGGPDPQGRARRFVLNLARLGYVEIPLAFPTGVRYPIERELGRGAVGVAYLARKADGTPVVLKVAWDFYAPLEEAENALQREADALVDFEHPGIVRAVDVYRGAGRLHLVRDFVDGEEIAVAQRVGMPVDTALRVAAEVADAAAHVHARGYLLRDFRPANFLRREGDGRVLLVDVGQCRRAPDLVVRLEAPAGAPGFLPPETLEQGTVTARSDVWALGSLLLFLQTGIVPPRRPDLSGLLREADPRVAAVAARFVARDPADRVATMEEAARLLRAG